MPRFRKKPVEIDAMQLAGTAADCHAVYQWVERNTQGSFDPDADELPGSGVSIDPATGFMLIATLEGVMQAKPGDWIIRGVQDEFYPCRPDIFETTYEPVFEATFEPVVDQHAHTTNEASGRSMSTNRHLIAAKIEALRALRDFFRAVDMDAAADHCEEAAIGCEGSLLDLDRAESLACAWADYRNDYGVHPSDITAAHKAFKAGWQAALKGDQSGVLR